MNEKELLALVKKYNTGIDGISDEFVKELEKYQREYERALYKINFDIQDGYLKTNQANFNRAMSVDGFNKLGFEKLAINHISEYNNVAQDRLTFTQAVGVSTDLNFRDLEIVKALQKLDLELAYGQGQELDLAIKKALVNSIATKAPYKDSIQSISDDLLGAGEKVGMLARYADTYLRTSLFALSRSVDQEIYESVGGFEKYLYIGPVDKRTRPFCLEHVGGVFTVKEIEKWPQENGSGLDPFVYGAGWNCRHNLIPYIE